MRVALDALVAHCADLLLPLLGDTHGFGGSQAQRSLIHLTATEAARRAGDTLLWEALRSESAARKAPHPAVRRHERMLKAA